MRAIVLTVILACSSLLVPLTGLAVQQFTHAPSVQQSESDISYGFNVIHGLLVKPQQDEPGSGGGGGGVI